MEPKQFRRRVWAIVVLLAIMLTSLGSTLYDLQINNGDKFYAESQYKTAETETVEAGRGQILDRNGRPLVSDRAVYQVRLNPSLMGKAPERNAILLSLVQVSREHQVEWADTLPISRTEPFTFTTEDPYFTINQDKDGNEVKKLTQLGRLAVVMKWIKDPTEEPETEEPVQEEEPGFLDKLKDFFSSSDAKEEPVQEDKPYVLPDARQLLGKMCKSFDLKAEDAVDEKKAKETGETVPDLNIGSMDPADARDVAGVLYELYLRSKDINRVSYLFAPEVDIDFISRVKELSLDGVVIEARTVRQYNTKYAAHLLGQVGAIQAGEWDYYKSLDLDEDGKPDYQMDDTVGRSGVESAFESYLRGTPGVQALERNKDGKVVAQQWLTEPKPGDNVVLTLDLDLQTMVEDTLAKKMAELEADSTQIRGAACVALNAKTSEVLAMASYPTFDLSTLNSNWNELAEDPLSPTLNRALMGIYPPGSTFKLATAIAGLEEGIITPSTIINTTGKYTYYGETGAPKCWIYRQYGGIHGPINVSRAIEVSCNYFFFDVGRQLGIQKLDEYARNFGLGQKTGIELAEATGILAGPEYTESLGGTWYEGSTLSAAIGQESHQFTPVQIANYIATLVNGGTRKAVHLLKEVKSSDFSQVLYTYEPEILSEMNIKEQNLRAVKEGMLALTTQSGSVAKQFRNLENGILAGAKTGSAQVAVELHYNSVFVCFAPYDDPELVLAFVVERGGSGADLAEMSVDVFNHYFSTQENREELLTENTLIR